MRQGFAVLPRPQMRRAVLPGRRGEGTAFLQPGPLVVEDAESIAQHVAVDRPRDAERIAVHAAFEIAHDVGARIAQRGEVEPPDAVAGRLVHLPAFPRNGSATVDILAGADIDHGVKAAGFETARRVEPHARVPDDGAFIQGWEVAELVDDNVRGGLGCAGGKRDEEECEGEQEARHGVTLAWEG